MPWELPFGGDPSATPEQREATRGITREEADAIRDAVAADVLEHAKSRGTEAGGMGRWAAKRLSPPEVDWRRELRAAVSSGIQQARGMDDYSYVRPSRRGSFCGVIQPSLVAPVPQVVVVIDTSGSMGQRDLDAALGEVEGVIRALGQREVRIISCDSKSTSARRVRSARDVKLIGGGGTDMRVGIAAAIEAKGKVVVVLTDGYTPWPDVRPRRVRVIAGMVGHTRDDYPRHPEWLRCVAIPRHQLRAD
jgi:predicted metal-dependent peptidase